MLCPVRFRTELATEIANIGYFKIASGNHENSHQLRKKDFAMKSFFLGDPLGF